MKDVQTVIYLHIPKTAGSTFHTIIEQQYTGEAIYSTYPAANHSFGTLDEFMALSDVEKEGIRVLLGHFGFGIDADLPGSSIYITILRDPIERMISDFYHINRDPNHGLYELVSSGEMDMKAYISHLNSINLDNAQTRMLAGDWGDRGREPCSAQMLEVAKKNLASQFTVVGLTERFDETLLLLRKKLGWRYLFYTRRNVTRNRPARREISAKEMQILQEHTKFDSQLYAFAQKLFTEAIEQQGTGFERELKMFQLLNRLYNLNVFNRLYWRMRQYSVREFLQKWQQRLLGRVS